MVKFLAWNWDNPVADGTKYNMLIPLNLKVDESVIITATGTWSFDPHRPACGPDGNGVVAAGGAPLPGVPEASLLVRTVGGPWMFVGSQPFTFNGPVNNLYFIMNYNGLGNGSNLFVTLA
jgi:hypothetical protein